MATNMTRKDLAKLYSAYDRVRVGYCCYQEDGVSKFDLHEFGYNSGIYGWNWTAYADLNTNTLYISCYRNVPSYMVDKG